MKTILAAAILGLALGCVTLAKSPGPAPLLERVMAPDESVREAARAEWKALEEEPRFRLALAGLRSEDPEIAWFCADRLDPWRLNLEELRRRATLMARHPERYFLPDGEGDILAGLGAPEIPTLLRHFAKLRIEDPDRFRDEGEHGSLSDLFQQIHREMSSEHLPLLVSLLPAEDPTVFRSLLALLDGMALYAGEHRPLVARGFLYGRARIEAEKAGKTPRPLDGFRVDAPRSGLPEALVTIARRAFFPEPWTESWRDPDRFDPCSMWTLRWARTLTADDEDIPFLLHVARRAAWIGPKVWALRALAGMDGDAAVEFVRETAAGESDLGPFAAAELARRGERDRFRELLFRSEPPRACGILALETAPEMLIELMRVPLDDERAWFPWALGAESLATLEADYGIRIPPEHFVPLVRAAVLADEDGSSFPGLFSVLPEAFDRDLLDLALARAASGPDRPDVASRLLGLEESPGYALLEVRDLAALRRHVQGLAAEARKAADVDTREECTDALDRLIARLGDSRDADMVLRRLPHWLDEEWGSTEDTAVRVGGIRNERIRAVLREWAGRDDPKRVWSALLSLCVMGGVDRRMLPVHRFDEPDLTSEPWPRIRALVLEGDPIGALVELSTAEPTEKIAWLGLSRDPRAVRLLRRLRAERRLYWPATAGLALAGEAAAKAELIEFLRDNRTVLLDDLHDLYLPGMEADPAIIDLLIERAGQNCCAACYALWALGMRFPTLDTGYDISNLLEVRRRIRAWYVRNRDRLAWSRIAGGYVPK